MHDDGDTVTTAAAPAGRQQRISAPLEPGTIASKNTGDARCQACGAASPLSRRDGDQRREQEQRERRRPGSRTISSIA